MNSASVPDTHTSEFKLLKSFLENINIQVSTLEASELDDLQLETLRIFSYFLSHDSIRHYLTHVFDTYDRHTLYKLDSMLLTQYYLFFLPGDSETLVLVGPFCEYRLTEEMIRRNMELCHAPVSRYEDLIRYYHTIREVSEPQILQSLLTTFCGSLYGGMDRFRMEKKDFGHKDRASDHHNSDQPSEDVTNADRLHSMDILADRYALENSLMHAVSKGELHSAEMYFAKFASLQAAEPRAATALRNSQNYAIILNTLLRKSAEIGKVHPIYIDQLSSKFAHRIEACRTQQDVLQLRSEMVRKYCLLVSNHSMQNYSKLVQQALTIIHSDLTAELSLSGLAAALNVNASYLSTKFRQELGKTLTDYIAQKRVEHAILLLNSTDLPIAEIACACGIPDVQYFSKIFKRQIGHTPTGYRKLIHPDVL